MQGRRLAAPLGLLALGSDLVGFQTRSFGEGELASIAGQEAVRPEADGGGDVDGPSSLTVTAHRRPSTVRCSPFTDHRSPSAGGSPPFWDEKRRGFLLIAPSRVVSSHDFAKVCR